MGALTGSREPSPSCTGLGPSGFDPERIVALVGDKYSPNLRTFLAKQSKHRGPLQRVFKDAEGVRWIGFIDDEQWFTGTRLFRVLCVGKKAEVGAFAKLAGELTEDADFWRQYEAIGRCALDEAHIHWFVNGDDRFTYKDDRFPDAADERRCRWCGFEQRRVRWTETVERHRWEAASAIETRQGGDVQQAPSQSDESAVPTGDAQND
jgi:hypothetical protein